MTWSGISILCSLALACPLLSGQNDAISSAVEALQNGNLVSAESTLRDELRVHPKDEAALGVLGVVLDQKKKYDEANEIYQRALAISPHSAALLNNYGNHLVAAGKADAAKPFFLKVLAAEPTHANAIVQLAHIALAQKQPGEAAGYLDRLPANAVDIDPRLLFSLGEALAEAGKYGDAEKFFGQAAKATPTDFQTVYDLGLAASHAGHQQRAWKELQRALELQPGNVDAMYDLAAVDTQMNQKEAALELLARAERLAPDRADIVFLLAHTSADLGYFGDAAKAWEKYMLLKPDDDAGRREHAFAQTALGEDMQSGLADLRWYVQRHPNDAVGQYELGTAQSPSSRDEALKELNRAVALKPDFIAAHVARGLLYYREGKADVALEDFRFAAQRDPQNPAILDRMGQIYMALGRTGDALPVLRKAADLAPRDSTILFHYARALSKAGNKEEASAVFARCRELGPGKSALPHPAGLVEFLSLSPQEQQARYRAGVERTVQRDPTNVEAQVRYLELLLEDGKIEDTAAVTQRIITLNPSPALIAEAARSLLAAGQYAEANAFLEQFESKDSSGELRLDHAIAESHVVNAEAGLNEMSGIPQAKRNGDYYLALAAMLEAAGRASDARVALNQALKEHAVRPELYRETASQLLKDHRSQEALELLNAATRTLPENAELLMMKDALDASLR